ncbi:MAG: cysteine hydrolase [Actinomycetota bacterium]
MELATLVAPAHTAFVTQECQNGVIGDPAVFPALADTARASGMIDNCGRLAKAARAAGVTVAHVVAVRRPDGRGANTNARVFAAARKSAVSLEPGSEATKVVPEIGVEPGDFLIERHHGLGPMHGTDLDPILRNAGVTTIVGVGASVNVGMTNFAMDAVNLGYQFVLPRDAVAGVPADYADQVIEHTLSYLATVVTTEDLVRAWEAG